MAVFDDTSQRDRSLVTLRRVQRERLGGEALLAVLCPRQFRVVDLAECRHCEDHRGLCIAAYDRELFLRCAFRQADGALETSPGRESSLAHVATAPAHCVAQDADLQSVLALLVVNAISAAPVVDASGRAIGIVTKTDLLRAVHELQEADLSEDREAERADAIGRLQAARVRDIMSHAVFTLHAEADVNRAAALMAYEGVHHVVVTSQDGRAVGIVSSLDIMRWLARRNGYLIAGGRRTPDQ